MFNIAQIKKQAARMEQQMKEIQAQLAIRTVDATSGGGAVKVTAKCDGSLAAIKIDPQALNPNANTEIDAAAMTNLLRTMWACSRS